MNAALQVASAGASAVSTTERKRIATLQARAALAGATLIEISDDKGRPELILSRWALTRAFRDFDELDATLTRMGAPA